MSKVSEILMHQSARQIKRRGAAKLAADQEIALDDIQRLGIGFAAMDSGLVGNAVTTGYVPAETLQTWMAGTIRAITTPVDIDFIAGITTVGNWHDEEINVRTEEALGTAQLYGDSANIPLAGNNPGYESRQVVRFEQGFSVGTLERRRLGAAGFDQDTSKRRAVAASLDATRNAVGWSGVAGTTTYGLLNDLNLPTALSQTSGVTWDSGLTFDEAVADFVALRNALDNQMGIALRDDATYLFVLPTGYRGFMNLYNTAGTLSFGGWLKENYPNLRVEYAAKLKDASATNKDLVYLIAENVANLDESTVDSATVTQLVPARYEVIGSETRPKEYVETASNALAGVMVLRPWAVARKIFARA